MRFKNTDVRLSELRKLSKPYSKLNCKKLKITKFKRFQIINIKQKQPEKEI